MKPINWKRILLVSLITIVGMYIYLVQEKEALLSEAQKDVVSSVEKVQSPLERSTKIDIKNNELKSKKTLEFTIEKETKVGLNYERRGTLKVRISNAYKPSSEEIKALAHSAYTSSLKRKYSEEFTVFVYLDGMNINSSAFAFVEFANNKVTYEFMSDQWDDMFAQ